MFGKLLANCDGGSRQVEPRCGVILDILGQAGRLWPVILIVIGLSIVWKRFSESESEECETPYEKSPSDLKS